ncbi:MAG TPA: hypothetical protein VLB50_07940 [Ignavibacteriaceae bacterium]|nr:hypothetical protein [Ignavibacteriaceae bacterium]
MNDKYIMKIYFQIFVVFILFPLCIFPQEIKKDSVKEFTQDNLQKLQIQFDEFEFYRDLNYLKLTLPAAGESNTIWMWTSLSINNSGSEYMNSRGSSSELISPLRQQFLENSKLNPVRYVLGMAQTAAVGYLAYRHLKKYGLFK